MKLTDKEVEMYREFATAAMQGWLARYPEDANFSQVNYGVVATGSMRMAAAMMNAFKSSLAGKTDSVS